MREQLRLQVLYPGEYVAVRYGTAAGHHASKGRGQEVLCHSRSLAEVQDYGAALPADQQQDVWLDYVEETPRLSAR